jgi:hypothetical protein
MLSHGGQMQSAHLGAGRRCGRPIASLVMRSIIGARNLADDSVFSCPIICIAHSVQPNLWQSVRDHAATLLTLLAPTMLSDLLDEGGSRATLPSLQKIIYSAAPMPESLLRRAVDAFGPIFAGLWHDQIRRRAAACASARGRGSARVCGGCARQVSR